VIVVTGNRADALARLDVLVGEWVVEARFPGDQPTPSGATGEGPKARSRFEWALGGQFLLQRTEIPIPEAPDSLTIVSADLETGAYTQHYYDSRGVVRLYAMTLAEGVWTLTRESADFTPLDVRQRFIGHVQPGREHHQRRLADMPGERRVGARLRPHLPQGRLT
jgi:hypothetical protein